MDLLDRMLGHDEWTTGEILSRCRELSDEQLDRDLGIDHGSVRATLAHMIDNVEIWTDLISGQPVNRRPADRTLPGLIERHRSSYARVAAFARDVRDRGEFDGTFVDTLDEPPIEKPVGGVIGHVVTHNMNHRAHLLAMLAVLGLTALPEGDLLGWEMSEATKVEPPDAPTGEPIRVVAG